MEITINNCHFNLTFMWDMSEDRFKELKKPLSGIEDMEYEYCGAVFFGDLKLDVYHNGMTRYFCLFVYDMDGPNSDYLPDYTPYIELDEEETNLHVHVRRTFERFAEDTEAQIVKLINKYPWLIKYAIQETEPNKWYPADKYGNEWYHINNYTRII